MDDSRRLGEGALVRGNLLEARKLQRAIRRRLRRAERVGDAPHVAQIPHALARIQAPRDLDDRVFPHSERQKVRLAVEQDGAAHLVAPEVVVTQTPQRRLDAPRDHRNALVGLSRALAIGQRRPVRPHPDPPARRVGVIVPHFPVGRVVIDHRVHVAGADGEEQPRPAEAAPVVARLPIRLRDDADSKPRRLQHTSENPHREARVIDVGIASHEHDVDAVPATLFHLRGGHG